MEKNVRIDLNGEVLSERFFEKFVALISVKESREWMFEALVVKGLVLLNGKPFKQEKRYSA